MAARGECVGGEEEHLALTEVERGFGGFKETGFIRASDGEAVLDDVNRRVS